MKQVTAIYQARCVTTQANAAGGAIIVDISLAAGQIAKLIYLSASNSGTNDIEIALLDEDNASSSSLGYCASAAANMLRVPSIGSAATGGGNRISSIEVIIPSGAKLSVIQSGASVQNHTLTIAIGLELFNDFTIPTWSKARSTNAADVTIAASTISAANTLTAGRVIA